MEDCVWRTVYGGLCMEDCVEVCVVLAGWPASAHSPAGGNQPLGSAATFTRQGPV